MMKIYFLMIALSAFTFNLKAEVCSANIKDIYGNNLEHFAGESYSRDAACSEAMYQCNRSLSDARSNGRYYDANCEVEPIFYPTPNPYPNPNVLCQTDLLDQWNRIVRSFSGYGRSQYEACSQSEQFCREELYRNTSYGMRCVTRNGPNPNPYPPRNRTESCTANRFDPAGMFIESYNASATGSINEDVKGQACNQAMNLCQREIRGRQFCNIAR